MLEKDLFFSLIEYKPNDSYYTRKDEKLEYLLKLANNIDMEQVIKISWYCSKVLGMKLSPVITNTFLYMKANMLKDFYKNIDYLKFVIRDTYTRPDFISNSLEFYEQYLGTDVKNIPNSLKNTYTKVLESYGDLTLKKFKMKKKEYSLADLIKVFRPNPMKAKKLINKNLYKDIIENKAPLEQETITDVLSNATFSKEEKTTIINKSIDKMPINQIIKNLKNIDYAQNYEIVSKKLKDCFSKETALRYINPYDLIFSSKEIDTRWLNLLDTVLLDWLKTYFETDDQEYSILFDKSGSMYWSGDIYNSNVANGAKFLSLIIPVLKNYKFYLYDTSLKELDKKLLQRLHNKCTPNQIYETLLEITKQADGGTNTISCLRQCSNLNPKDNIILITDEVTYDNSSIFDNCIKNPLILYCTDITQAGLFSLKKSMLRIGGANGNILPAIQQFLFFDKFLQKVNTSFDKAYEKFKNRK